MYTMYIIVGVTENPVPFEQAYSPRFLSGDACRFVLRKLDYCRLPEWYTLVYNVSFLLLYNQCLICVICMRAYFQ